MTRLIKLFQAKANLAYDKYLAERERAAREIKELNGPEWQASIIKAAKLLAEANPWQSAAGLLRKEELNRV